MERSIAAQYRYYHPLIISFVLWTLWCAVMSLYPPLAAKDHWLRAVVRIGVVLIPALIYLRLAFPKPISRAMALINHRKGIAWGLGAGAILSLASLPMILRDGSQFELPNELAIWLNWIIISPFAEEILFRVVVFGELSLRLGPWKAALLSSFYFVLIHLPPILLLNTMDTWTEIVAYSINVFILSALFTLAFHKSESLWGSLLPHWINNLLSIGLSA